MFTVLTIERDGKINWVQIDIDAAAKDVDHLIGAEERFMIAWRGSEDDGEHNLAVLPGLKPRC